jgi:hypothetical protein
MDMMGFTVIAQVTDRIGMLACCVVALLLGGLAGVRSLGSIALVVLLSNFVTSGALIWFLARYYCARRWDLSRARSAIIATAAAILTNPAWAIGAGYIYPGTGEGR